MFFFLFLFSKCFIPIFFLGGFIMFLFFISVVAVVVVIVRQLYLVCFYFCCSAPCNMLLKGAI